MAVNFIVKETGVPGENHRTVASHWQTFSHNVVSSTPRHGWAGFELITLVMIGTNCIGSCKSRQHTIMTRMLSVLPHPPKKLQMSRISTNILSYLMCSHIADRQQTPSYLWKYYKDYNIVTLILYIWTNLILIRLNTLNRNTKLDRLTNTFCTNLTSNEIFSLAIVGILTADVYTENLL